MFEEIYLETDEEVTSAIDKIKKSKKDAIALCLPRNSVLGQSIVNLKLLYKQALLEEKQIALVCADRITRGLAERIGILAFESPAEVTFPGPSKPAKASTSKKKKAEEEEPSALARQRFDGANADNSNIEDEAHQESNPVDDEPKQDAGDIPEDDSAYEAPAADDDAADVPVVRGAGNILPTRGNLRFYRRPKRKRALWVPVVALILILLGGTGVAAYAYPRATVKITIVAQPLRETVETKVDTELTAIDADKASIPGKPLTLTKETKLSAKATGKKDVGTKAKGTVTLYNEWDSQTHKIASGTELKAKNGALFTTLAEATIPGASSTVVAGKSVINPGKIDVAVEASQPGDGGNVAATTFTIPSLSASQQDKIYATSSSTFKGGASDVVTVATQGDIDKAKESALLLSKDEAVAELKTMADNSILLEKAVQVLKQEATSSVAADEKTDAVEITVKGDFRVIVFTAEDHKQLLEKLLANKVPQGQKIVTAGTNADLDTTQFEVNKVEEKQIALTNNLKAFTVRNFDEAIIRRSLAGARPNEVGEKISKHVQAEKVEATLIPASWPIYPLSVKRITLEFTYTSRESQ